MGWFTDEIEHSDRYRVLLDVSDHLWRGGDDLVLQVGGPVSGFWIGYLAGLVTLPAVAVLVFLGLVVSALFPASYGWECCCCGETIIAERDSHPVPGLIAWARFRAHRLTKRHRINHKAWVEAGRPYIDWKPVA